MRVISKEKDFYDTAGFINPENIFLRKTEEIKFNILHPSPYRLGDVGVLGFCGKFYPYVYKVIESSVNLKTGRLIPEERFYYYSLDTYFESPFFSKREYRWSLRRNRKDYIDFFNHWRESDELFIKLNAPYFKVKEFVYPRFTKGSVIINPSLIDMQFGKVKDAFTTFQEIEMYLTNQLVQTKEPEEIDDEYRIAQHGYDKYSFRHPTKLKDLK